MSELMDGAVGRPGDSVRRVQLSNTHPPHYSGQIPKNQAPRWASGFLHRVWECSALSSAQMLLLAAQVGSVGDHWLGTVPSRGMGGCSTSQNPMTPPRSS